MSLFVFPIGSIRPQPGSEAGDIELPGPGLYEGDFGVPPWLTSVLGSLGAGEFESDRQFTVPFANGMDLTHEQTRWRGDTLTIRVRLVDNPSKQVSKAQISATAPTVRLLVKTVLSNFKLVLATGIITAIAAGLREVRKMQEVTSGQLLIAGGAFFIVAAGVVKLRGA